MQPGTRYPPPNPCIDRLIEVAHILFMDIVGIGRLPMDRQTAVVEELQQIVRATDEFRRAEVRGELLRRFTGDGMLLIFQSDVLCPIRCAIEVARALKTRPHIPLRMGINSGPIHYIHDINNQINVSGEGVIKAQRVMDCADQGFILVSENVASTMRTVPAWARHLRYLGECKIKHGQYIALYSLVTDEVGVGSCPRKMLDEAASIVEARQPRERIRMRAPAASGLSKQLLSALFVGLLLGGLCFLAPGYRTMAGAAWDGLFTSRQSRPQLPEQRTTQPLSVDPSGRNDSPPDHVDGPGVSGQPPVTEPSGGDAAATAPVTAGSTAQFRAPEVSLNPAHAEQSSGKSKEATASDEQDPPQEAPHHMTGTIRIRRDGCGPRTVYVQMTGEDSASDQEKRFPKQSEGDTVPFEFDYTGAGITLKIFYETPDDYKPVWERDY